MTDQWSVLATLTPTEYSQFRHELGKSSGFQSAQYRTLEFLLGNKNPAMVAVFAHDPAVQQQLTNDLHSPSLYDEFLLYLGRRGYPIPAELLDRDWSAPHILNTDLVRSSPASTTTPNISGMSTKPARNSSTSRTPSRPGGSGISRRSNGSSATSAAPAVQRVSHS